MIAGKLCVNISCKYKEYRLVGNKWIRVATGDFRTDSSFINNILESSSYFSSLGGTVYTDYSKNRRFGLVPNKISCLSICGTVKKIYVFKYDQAQVI